MIIVCSYAVRLLSRYSERSPQPGKSCDERQRQLRVPLNQNASGYSSERAASNSEVSRTTLLKKGGDALVGILGRDDARKRGFFYRKTFIDRSIHAPMDS
jgi:hypothetical protein